jgi:hypothetical protein
MGAYIRLAALRPSQRTVAFLIVALGFAIRLFHLGAMGLEYDEAFSVQAGFRDVASIMTMLATLEPHPPFFYTFVHFWYPVVGTTEFALRYATVAASVLTIAGIARVASMVGWRAAGLVGAALFAVNPYQVWYAQEVRMYAPVAMFGVLAVMFGLAAVQRGRWRDLAGYAACMLLALATHYYATFLYVFIGGVILLRLRVGAGVALTWRRWLAANAAVAAFFLGWLIYAFRVSLYYIRDVPNPAAYLGVIKDSLTYYAVGTSVPRDLAFRLALVFLVVIAVGFWSIGRQRDATPRWFRYLFLAGYLFLPLGLGFVVSLFRSLYAPNYFMVSAPAFYLALGLGVAGLWRIARPLGTLSFLVLVAIDAASLHNYFFDPQYNKAEVTNAISYVEKHLVPGDGIVLDGLGQTTQFWYYHTIRAASTAPHYVFPLDAPDPQELVPANIDAIMAKQHGVWLLDYGVIEWDRQQVVETYLAKNYYQAIYKPIYHNRVVYYAAPPPTPPRSTAVNVDCAGAVRVLGVQTFADTARPGDVVPVALQLQAEGSARADYVVSWRLEDAVGHTVYQHDAEPADGFSPTSAWRPDEIQLDRLGVVVPESVLPGRYTLAIAMYAKQSGGACQWQQDGHVLANPAVAVTQVDVSAVPSASGRATTRPSHAAATTVGNLTYLGYDLVPGPYRPGDVATARLVWRVDRQVPTDYLLQARLIDAGGSVLWSSQTPLGPDGYTTTKWQPGRTVATYLDVPVPARAASGSDRLSLQIVAPGLQKSVSPAAAVVQVAARPRTFTPPAVPNPLNVNFGGAIRLLGYGLGPAPTRIATPGEQLRLTLYWQDLRALDGSFKVFTHLVGPDGKIYGQDDSIPENGLAPTTGWLPGEFIADHYDLGVPSDVPPGDYQIAVGFYDATTGNRIPLGNQPGDTAVVTDLTVDEN